MKKVIKLVCAIAVVFSVIGFFVGKKVAEKQITHHQESITELKKDVRELTLKRGKYLQDAKEFELYANSIPEILREVSRYQTELDEKKEELKVLEEEIEKTKNKD